MKKALVCLVFSFVSPAVAAPMARVIGIRDSRTIVIATNGAMSTVTMTNVSVPAEEEAAALDYLQHQIANAWVYVDGVDVYRSPDALYVNGDMNRHPWRTMKYLGEIDLGERAKGQPAGNKVTEATLPPMKQPKTPSIRVTRRPRGKSASR